METVNQTLLNLDVIISWWVVLLTLASGEITKLLWPVKIQNPKISKAWRIFIVAVGATCVLAFLRKTPIEVWIISVAISYCVHALFAKHLIDALNRLISKWNK